MLLKTVDRFVTVRMKRKYCLLVLAILTIVLLYFTLKYSRSVIKFCDEILSAKQFQIHYTTNISYETFPEDAKPIFITESPYLIHNSKLCASDSVIKYIVVVHSAVSNVDLRNNLRQTWANPKVFSQFQVRTVFFLGKPSSTDAQAGVQKESGTYKDIVQGDFIDHYNNLTLKALTVLRWVTEECSNAQAVIKVDDDVFVDIFKIVWEVLPLLELHPKQIICSGTANAFIYRSNSISQRDKWTLSYSYFPGLLYFPMPYCYGQAVFMSQLLVQQLFLQAKSSPIFFIDDTFVFGVIADKIPGISWRFLMSSFSVSASETLASFRYKPNKDSFLVGTAKDSKSMYELWEIVNGFNRNPAIQG